MLYSVLFFLGGLSCGLEEELVVGTRRIGGRTGFHLTPGAARMKRGGGGEKEGNHCTVGLAVTVPMCGIKYGGEANSGSSRVSHIL